MQLALSDARPDVVTISTVVKCCTENSVCGTTEIVDVRGVGTVLAGLWERL